MIQSYVAWDQLISYHPTSCIAVGWRLDDPDPFPQGPPIPQGGGGVPLFYLYPEPILLSLRCHIWSGFQYLTLTYILATYFSIHVNLAWNPLPSYQLHCCWWEVGWPPPLPRAHPFHRGQGGWCMQDFLKVDNLGSQLVTLFSASLDQLPFN